MNNIDILQYQASKAWAKLQEKALFNNWAKEAKSEKDDWDSKIKKFKDSITEDDDLVTVKEGWIFSEPFYFHRKENGIDTELIYNPKTKLFHIETCECVVECCGRKLGWHKEENIEKIIKEHYEG